jgi:serine/threonine protein kinase
MSDTPQARPGSVPSPDEGSDALPIGARLAEFEIRQVIGAGGFGIVYRAWDEALQRDVALKEYMPVSLAGRGASERVTLRSRMHEETFALGLQSFVNEARLLARFDHPALVKVFRFWEANGTAYMAMPLYKGRTLRQMRKALPASAFDDAWMRTLIDPLLGALEVMHDAEIYHRDIAPDNILWCDDGRPVLLDFGAARLVLADRTQNVTAILKPQFAPIEQYAETQAMRQGPWTDLYALAGTCFFMLTGRAPLPATARVLADEQESLMRLMPPGCSARLMQVLDWALAVRPQDRPQSVAQFRDALAGRVAAPPRPARAGAVHEPATTPAGAGPAAYEKTVQVTRHTPSSRPAPAPRTSDDDLAGPVTRIPHDDELERPERSVLLPPKSRSPLTALVAVLVVAGAAGAAWMTRAQWMPMVGLQDFAPPVATNAPPPEPAASAVDAGAAPASAAVAEAAPSTAASAAPLAEAAASAPPSPASESVATAPVPVRAPEPAPAPAPEAAPPQHAVHAKPAATHSKPAATRPSNFVLPPPVLPPTNEAQVGARPAPAAKPTGDQPEPAAVAATATPSVQHAGGPREACADQGDAARIAACVKQLCDNDPRYQRFPVCQRVRRKEEQQQEHGAEQ